MRDPESRRNEREAGRIVYPAASRRSGGLSLGLNLFPDGKACSFDCPYCEVFAPQPASGPADGGFSLEAMEAELEAFLASDYADFWALEPIRDLCLSGNGEPSLSPHLGEALGLLASVRRKHPRLLASTPVVIITNSTGFLVPSVAAILERSSREEGLVVWAKLDAGSEGQFRRMSGIARDGAGLNLERITRGLLAFARTSPIVVQTMLCSVDGRAPTEADLADYAATLSSLVARGARIAEVHLYTYARPSPAVRCASLSDDSLARHAAFVRGSTRLRVRAFGRAREIAPAEAPAQPEAGA
jgi:histidinol dehydrogenase